MWAPQKPEDTLPLGPMTGCQPQGGRESRPFPESSLGFLSFRALVRNNWGKNVTRILTPSVPWPHGTQDILWCLCSNPVQWAHVFLFSQLWFPLSLLKSPLIFLLKNLSALLVWCPPLTKHYEHDPRQTNCSCPCRNVGLGQDWHLERKLPELIKAGIQALKSLPISLCFSSPPQLPWAAPLPQVPGTTPCQFPAYFLELAQTSVPCHSGSPYPFPAQKKSIPRSRELMWKRPEKPAPSWQSVPFHCTLQELSSAAPSPPHHITLCVPRHPSSQTIIYFNARIFFSLHQVIFINLSF